MAKNGSYSLLGSDGMAAHLNMVTFDAKYCSKHAFIVVVVVATIEKKWGLKSLS